MNQTSLNSIAENLDVRYDVIDNLTDGKLTYRAKIMFTNNSAVPLIGGSWQIYFCHLRMIEPDVLPEEECVVIEESGVSFSHINGCLFKMEPTMDFKTLHSGKCLTVLINGQFYSIAKTDVMPNWYFTAEGCSPTLIRSTVDETLGFVGPFNSPRKWKRFNYATDVGRRFDRYNPYSADERYRKNARADAMETAKLVVPTPLDIRVQGEKTVDIKNNSWIILCGSDLANEAGYLAGKTGLNIQANMPTSRKNFIHLAIAKCSAILEGTTCSMTIRDSSEAYRLHVDAVSEVISIRGSGPPGVFYGVQTLLNLLGDDLGVPDVTVIDAPRFPYRGMHIDVSRNFHSVTEIERLLEVMAVYKMNKLHFHLTDDEGWRIEIPGLEELTQIGGKRGHDPTETSCILPVLGSGPALDTSASGFYSVQEYRDLLKFAVDHHIEIIPEIDMPGHAHAAIQTMEVRKKRLIAKGDKRGADEFALFGGETTGQHHSVQKYSNNAIDPGLDSTYRFVDKVVSALIDLHKDISPLRMFHFGGDEVPMKAWKNYSACQKLISSGIVNGKEDLMEYFVKRVSTLTAEHGLELGAWQDGIQIEDQLLERSSLKNSDVTVYAWHNRWDSGHADLAYRLANAGYKVVMALGTHLYFDHPYEPDPEERGLYWATRYIDTFKTFKFTPDDLLANTDEKITGEPIRAEDLFNEEKSFEGLKKPENVIGIQGQLWSELVRKPEQLHELVFPRLLALAERAWHKSSWETEKNKTIKEMSLYKDWSSFAATLGHKELRRLDELGVMYHVPPPGARLVDGYKLYANTAYPGLPIEYSVDGGHTWKAYSEGTEIYESSVLLQTRSADTNRVSRVIRLDSGEERGLGDGCDQQIRHTSLNSGNEETMEV